MDLKKEAHDLLLRNRRITDGHQYTVPSPETYPYQWLWDSCFHAIALSTIDPEAAKTELRTLLSRQLPDGMVPHIIYWVPGVLHLFEWGIKDVSALTQPPLVAQAVWQIYQRTEDKEFLKEVYPATLAFYRFLIEKRDLRDRHLISIINPDESGEDNSPRFDQVLNLPPDVSYDAYLERRKQLVNENRACNFDPGCMRTYFWVKDVPFNAVMVKNLEVLAHMAAVLENAEDEQYASSHAGLIRSAMRRFMLEDGVFWTITGENYDKLKVDTWSHFVPLFAGLYTPKEAETLMERYFEDMEGLRSPHGIRTVSKREPSYISGDDAGDFICWRGPIWMAPHWFIYRGLRAYGYNAEADYIRDHSIELIERNGFREYFSPDTGKGYGARNFTWGTLILDMLES